MTKIIKCSRCGNDIKIEKTKQIVSCGHCNLKMKIDLKSQKRFKLVRYLFMLIICILIALGMNLVSKNNYVILLFTLMAALLLANYADRLCLILTDVIFGLTYEKYIEEDRKKGKKK